MEIILISAAAFIISILTFFSGFGLGTILTPVFMVFFPVNLAIALTGVVHFFNNLFKVILVGKNVDKEVLIKFGLPAILAAFLGSWLLLQINEVAPLYTYSIGNNTFKVYFLKLIIAVLLIIFALFEVLPFLKKLQFGREKLVIGGVLSGFFGGLSGNQGALRTAFLVKAGLSKEAFIATGVVVSTLVDFSRLSVYASRFLNTNLLENTTLVVCATFSGILGSYVGNKVLKKVTLAFIQKLVAVLLIILSSLLAAGII